ncbi:uncharacterized protein ColSpa_03011 [Colletotrichum spaethianum]|uniref:Uncharacterized protein n=1 Tax=Colletotrichum spaethianum TaxID=700344 RepID=A0AA37NXX2_9PEZI|nr:uncharacterized protein ColSpa_03011 [Colletotrichum spaethianum]GKT42830.1 hypothetical protein ColSpa_03011 [Colletotrichum spaethianum]
MTSWQGGGWAEEGPCAGSRQLPFCEVRDESEWLRNQAARGRVRSVAQHTAGWALTTLRQQGCAGTVRDPTNIPPCGARQWLGGVVMAHDALSNQAGNNQHPSSIHPVPTS